MTGLSPVRRTSHGVRTFGCEAWGRRPTDRFAGSDRGAQRAAVMYTLIQTALCRLTAPQGRRAGGRLAGSGLS